MKYNVLNFGSGASNDDNDGNNSFVYSSLDLPQPLMITHTKDNKDTETNETRNTDHEKKYH